MPPLAKSKWDLKIHPATYSYHTRSRRIRWQEVINIILVLTKS